MTRPLFVTTPDLTVGGSEHWRIARDGDPIALELHARHYSARPYADGRPRRLFVGPGEKLVLVTHDDTAVLAWRRFISMDDQAGVCCSIFRNEGATLSSTLIREADQLADARWPDEHRHYTYVNAGRVRSTNPGYCFIRAGWSRTGWTKGGHGRDPLLVLVRTCHSPVTQTSLNASPPNDTFTCGKPPNVSPTTSLTTSLTTSPPSDTTP